MHPVLGFLGLGKKAGKVAVGEEPVGQSARSRHARLILFASDAADNSVRRGKYFAEIGKTHCLQTTFSKAELGWAVGTTACAMAAITDVGMAAKIAAGLAGMGIQEAAPIAQALAEQNEKLRRRQQEKQTHEKRKRKQLPQKQDGGNR